LFSLAGTIQCSESLRHAAESEQKQLENTFTVMARMLEPGKSPIASGFCKEQRFFCSLVIFMFISIFVIELLGVFMIIE